MNTNPWRFDLDHFGYLRLGAGVERKGWLTKGDVVNTLSLAELRKANDQELSHAAVDSRQPEIRSENGQA